MAIIKAGILSKVSGKVAGVVGSTWKGKNYLRELVKPANPNTALQQAQRGKMKACVSLAREFVGDVFKPYLDKFLKEMSGYNYFVKSNIAKFSGANNALAAALDVTFGNLGSGSAYWFRQHGDNSLSCGESTPSVPAGHTLHAIGAVVNVTKGRTVIKDVANASAEDPIIGSEYLDFCEAGDKCAEIVFFADVDANGVVQAISTNLKEFVTLT